jgi:O-antigen/teichoic acid export membrane protein
MLAIPMIIGCLGIGDIFVPIFFGSQYKAAVPTLYILSCLIVILGMGQLQGQFLIAINRQRYYSFATISALIINFIIALVLITTFHLGATGASLATVVSEIVATAIEAYYLKDVSGLESYFKFFIHYLFLGTSVMLSIFIIRSIFTNYIIILVLSVILGSLLYMTTLLLNKDRIFITIIRPIIKKLKNW